MIDLGPISDCDVSQIYKWRNNPKIYKWCRQFERLDWRNHQAWYDGLQSRSDVKMYNIFALDILKNIGVCGFTDIDLINRHAEFSLYIGPEFQGFGYGPLALKALVKHGFERLGLNHIFGETFEDNEAAKMFEKVGFQYDGKRRSYYFRDGRYIDAHLYSIIKGELND